MKKFSILLALCFSIIVSFAQHVPQGMKYQAVARNIAGNIIANQEISLKINLVTQQGNNVTVYYSETHTITTNALGLFSITIGEGKIDKGTFASIPWSTADIWMQVAIKDKGKADFVTVSNSKLLAVPYAFHSETANTLVGTGGKVEIVSSQSTAATNGVPAQVWSLKGNSGVDPTTDRLGTTDLADLVLITNNIERLRITAAGDINLKNTLNVGNNLNVTNNTEIGNDLTVKNNVKLNTVGGTTDIKGATNLQSTLDVTGATHLKNKLVTDGITTITNNTQSNSPSDGSLVTVGGAGIGGNLNVGGKVNFGGASTFGGQLHITDLTESTSPITGALIVDGGTGIGKNLNVGGTTIVKGATTLGSTLDVTDATHLKNTLTTDGATNINNSLTVTKNDPNFVATIINTNEGEGDGLKIKLGKAKSVYTLPAVPTFNQTEINQFKDLIRCDYNGNKLTLLGDIITNGIVDDVKSMAGIAVGAGNMIIKIINDGLNLPLSIGPYSTPAFHIIDKTTLFPGLDLGLLGSIPKLEIPALDIPKLDVLPKVTVMPKLPTIDLTGIGIPSIPIFDLDFWSVPNICLSDAAGSTPLNNDNEFIRFADKDDKKVGSIRGVSVTDWAKNYLNPSFLFKLRGALLSSKVDKFHAQYHFKNEISTALASYATIGVEYTSGNGDYAEWLERMDKDEFISAGDIVAVKGGKITKDLKGAEQIMVVSSNPIILGNTPAEGKNFQGNNIAFMGQVPVKIMGPVSSGDYILGQSNTPGYGIAKHPNQMSIEDYKIAVGRSWANDQSEDPKTVNTVVGVHNNNFLDIIKDLKQKEEVNDERLKAIEAKLYMSTPLKSKVSGNKSLK